MQPDFKTLKLSENQPDFSSLKPADDVLDGFATASQKRMPILTDEQGGFGTALKDVTVGAGKAFIRGTRDVAGGLQKLGKGLLSFGGADTSELGFKSLDGSTEEGKAVDEMLKSKSRAEQVGTVIENVAEFGIGFTKGVLPTYNKAKKAMEASKEAKAVETVADLITPKATAKEVKLAQTEGRLIKGKEATLFKSGTDDVILPSSKTKKATETIIKKIPGASKMKPDELYNAVDNTITETAESLRPQMKATKVQPETIQKINDDWTKLKKTQIELADATEEANVMKIQKQFEERLMKSGNQTHEDLWETAIQYDKSIPDNVKKANALSPESLQNKKEIWLQNRAVLRDAINDNAYGMGETSQKAFSELSDLYEASNSLVSKAKVEKAQMSKINQFLKDNPKVAKVLGGVTFIEIARRLGVNPFD